VEKKYLLAGNKYIKKVKGDRKIWPFGATVALKTILHKGPEKLGL